MNVKISRITYKAKAKELNLASFDHLKEIIIQSNWSPSTFNNNRRKNSNFKATDLMVLDVDTGFDLKSAINLFKDFKHIIGTTKSHQKKKGDVVADRYRVLLFLEGPITDIATFNSTWIKLFSDYPFIDKQCSDACRMYYPCIDLVSINESGKLISPVIGDNVSSLDTIIMDYSTMGFGESYIPLILKALNEKLSFKKIKPKAVAKILAHNITGLRNGKARLNIKWMANELKISWQGAKRVIDRLIDAQFIQPVNKRFYIRGIKSRKFKVGAYLAEFLSVNAATSKTHGDAPSDSWMNGTAYRQMLKHIRYCISQGMTDQETLAFCKKRQGNRPIEKLRTDDEILYSIQNWRSKLHRHERSA